MQQVAQNYRTGELAAAIAAVWMLVGYPAPSPAVSLPRTPSRDARMRALGVVRKAGA